MIRAPSRALLAALAVASPLAAQTTSSPFPEPIRAEAGAVTVGVADFAVLPTVDGEPARMMNLVDEPVSGRFFVNGMRGPIWTVSHDGRRVAEYLDIDDARWGVAVQADGRERGFQSFTLHPDFAREGAPGYGRFYTWTDTRDTGKPAGFRPGGGGASHHTVLLEWVARDPAAAAYDGPAPRELMRFEQPYGNHNGGHIAFDPTLGPGDAEYGLLYVGSADGGSGGDPLDLAQDPASGFGKILRIDPLGSGAEGGPYGIPSSNPFADDGDRRTLGEVWASGVRNPQRFGWDPATGRMFVADIGQNTVEEVSPVTRGANLGWNAWEGSFRYVGREGVDGSRYRGDPAMTFPVVEYAHGDPLLLGRAAVTGVHVVRGDALPPLRDRVLFGDFPSGEIFAFDADRLPRGGNQGFVRVRLETPAGPRTLLQLIRERNPRAERADLRLGAAADGRVFLLNKHDGTIRVLRP